MLKSKAWKSRLAFSKTEYYFSISIHSYTNIHYEIEHYRFRLVFGHCAASGNIQKNTTRNWHIPSDTRKTTSKQYLHKCGLV